MFRDFEEEAMGGEKQIFVDVAMVIKTMLLNPGKFTIMHVDTFPKNSLRLFHSRSSWDHEPTKTEAEALIKMKSSCRMTQENIKYDFWPESTWSSTIYRHIWKSYPDQEFFETDYQTLSKLYANCWSAASRCWNYRTRGKSERSKLGGSSYQIGRSFVNGNFASKVND